MGYLKKQGCGFVGTSLKQPTIVSHSIKVYYAVLRIYFYFNSSTKVGISSNFSEIQSGSMFNLIQLGS